MTKATRTISSLSIVSVFALMLGLPAVWANEPGYGKDGHSGDGHSPMGGHGMGMMHSSAGHLIRHLLKHEKDIGLTADQVTKLKSIQLNLDKARIKAEADIQIAERELKALTDDEKSDLGAIEAKLKQSEDMQVALRMTSIKTRREVLGLLTPEQRAKEKAEHDKMMQQHKEGGKAPVGTHGGGMMNPHGGNPHGTPQKDSGGSVPTPPSSMSVN
jgi:periplasmic protein CpxP/Spy